MSACPLPIRPPVLTLRQAAEAVATARALFGSGREVDQSIRQLECALGFALAQPDQLYDDILRMTITLADGTQAHQVYRRVEPRAMDEALGGAKPHGLVRKPLDEMQRARVLHACATIDEAIDLVEEMHGIHGSTTSAA